MRYSLHVLFLGSIFSLAAIPALAELSGNDLLAMCIENDFACNAYVRGYTLGLQRGVIRGLLHDDPVAGAASLDDQADSASGVCAPGGVTTGQITDVVIKFLKDNPEVRHEGIDILTFRAISQAFPCS